VLNYVSTGAILFYFTLPNSIRMSWAEHAERIREIRNAYEILVGKTEEKRPLEDLGTDGRTGTTLHFKMDNK
jgi:hypothetical protein